MFSDVRFSQQLSCCGDFIIPKNKCFFNVDAPIYSIILLENPVLIPHPQMGKLS